MSEIANNALRRKFREAMDALAVAAVAENRDPAANHGAVLDAMATLDAQFDYQTERARRLDIQVASALNKIAKLRATIKNRDVVLDAYRAEVRRIDGERNNDSNTADAMTPETQNTPQPEKLKNEEPR